MRAAPIILVVSMGLMAGWLTPRASETGSAATVSVGGEASPGDGGSPRFAAQRQTSREAWLSGGTVLERQGDGHFYADARVDSRDLRFLVDTGASIVALTGADAEALGLTWNEGDLQEIGRGASGAVRGVPVTLDSVELGGYEARGVQAAIIPDGLDVSLLGQSFLARLEGVRIDGDRMTLGAN